MPAPNLNELCADFKQVYPAAITHFLDIDIELHNKWLGPEIHPLDPEMRLAGPAFPMRFVNDPVIMSEEGYERITTVADQKATRIQS